MCLYVFGFVGMFIENNQINTLFLIVSHLCSFWPGIRCRLQTHHTSYNSNNKRREIAETACPPLFRLLRFGCRFMSRVHYAILYIFILKFDGLPRELTNSLKNSIFRRPRVRKRKGEIAPSI